MKNYTANINVNKNISKLYEAYGNLSTASMASELNKGALFVNFASHGNPGVWLFYWVNPYLAWYNGYGISDVQGLTNGFKLPVVTTMACSTARFDDQECIAEWFVLQPNGGSIAYFGATREAWGYNDQWITTGEMGEIDWRIYQNFYEGSTRLGQMWGQSIQEYVQNHIWNYQYASMYDVKTVMEFVLLGDPTLRVYNPAVPETLNVPKDYPTIQSAINAASNGDTIFVSSGTYYENLIVNKSLSLVGEKASTTIIDGGLGGNVVNITASHVKLTGFTVRGADDVPYYQSGIRISDSSTGNNVSGNNVEKNYDGIDLISSSNNTLSGNSVANSSWIGISLGSSYNNTLSGNSVANSSWWGIDVWSSSNNTFSGNSVANNTYGISLEFSSKNSLSGNNIANNTYGISLDSSSKNSLSGNVMENNRYNLQVYANSLEDYLLSIDTSNVVNGKPVYYFINQSNLVIKPSSYPKVGYLGLVNCSNVTVQGLNLADNGQGLLLAFTKDSKITGNNVTNNEEGIELDSSYNNTLSGNSVANNSWGIYESLSNNIYENNITRNDVGIADYGSSSNITGNNIMNSIYVGIDLGSDSNIIRKNVITSDGSGVEVYACSNNTFIENNVTAGLKGISLEASFNNSILGNDIVTANGDGVGLYDTTVGEVGSSPSLNNTVAGNKIVATNGNGVGISGSSGNTISGNTIMATNGNGTTLDYGGDSEYYYLYPTNNRILENNITVTNGYSVRLLNATNNFIFHNNFLSTMQVYSEHSANSWDDGYPSGGNYWINYAGGDANNDGIGDTPYVCEVNNIDHYPLMKPWTSYLFYDGFESGTFNAWTGTSVSSGEMATIANTPSHHGIYGAKYSSNGGGGTEYAYSYRTLASSSELFARSYFYVSQSGIADESDRFYTIIFKAGSNSVAYAGWKKTGGLVKWSLVVRSGTSYVYAYSAGVPSVNRWYCMELHWKEDAAAGLGELWVDGSLVCSITRVNTGTYGALTQVAFGLSQITNCASTTVFCDCVVVSRAYVGPEPQVPTPPYVSSHAPTADATNVAVTSSIQVTFSEPMNHASVESAFIMLPSVSGSFSWSSGDTVVTFTPTSNLAYNTLYNVTITSSAQDQEGQNMLSSYVWNFTTETNGQTSGTFGKNSIGTSVSNLCAYSYGSRYQITESGTVQSLSLYVQEATGSAIALKVAIYGDNAGIPVTLLAQGTTTVPANYQGWITVALTSKPSLSAGAYYWLVADAKVSGKTLRFYYSTGTTNQGVYGTTSYASFPANPCQYSARNARAYSIYCNYLTAAPSAPTVVNHIPSSDATGVSTSTSIQVTFTEPMDQTSTQNAFTISPSVSGSFSWSLGDTVMTFTPSASLAQGTLYTISISAAAQSKTAKSLVPCSWSFQTANAGVTETFGKTDVGGSQTNLCQYFYGSRYQVSKNGVAQSVSIRVSEGNGEARSVKVAIYSDAGGAPGNLLASGTGTVPAGTNGWVTIALTTTPNLAVGAYYWLVVDAMASGKTLRFYYSTGSTNQSVYGTTSLSSFPANSLSYAGFKDRAYSIYCNYITK